jgi:hypothetical protein
VLGGQGLANPAYSKKRTDDPVWDGPRGVLDADLSALSDESRAKVQIILDCMDWPQLVTFHYGDSDRLVAPFCVGVSSSGNPLLRGYQLEGVSLSGKGAGWRVFQVEKIEAVQSSMDYFSADDFDFDEFYPWIYKVFKML